MESNSTALIAESGSTTASKFLRSSKYSDLTIVCHGREFKVHKAILCPQSEVISKMCDIDTQELKTGMIEDKDFDDDTMERMIDFAYHKSYVATRRPKHLPGEEAKDSIPNIDSLLLEGASSTGGVTLPKDESTTSIPDEEPAELSTIDQMVIHARVYGLAEYYDMAELRIHACGCFNHAADGGLDPKGFVNVARAVCRKITRDDGSRCSQSDSPLRRSFFTNLTRYAATLARDPDFVAALYEPNLRDIAGDIFCALGERISYLEEEKKEAISELQAENEALQQSLTTTKENKEDEVATAQQRQRTAEEQLRNNEGVVHRLLKSLRNLSSSCANSWCSNEFGSLKFERNGNGDWQVRCGAKKCRCKLN
jgi:hypothetical protein